MIFEANSNGVFGEFLQGVGCDDQPFLITSPVKIYSIASFVFDDSLKKIEVSNPDKNKCQMMVDKICEKYQLKKGGAVSVETHFPVGKGLGSSSADLVAVAKVLSNAYTLNLNSLDIEDAIRGIEPTDGVMYPGIVSYYYKQVKLNKVLGKLKDAVILGVDEGGAIDTLEYNRVSRTYGKKIKETYDYLHAVIEKAVVKNDISIIGHVATQSGGLNQQFNPKKLFKEFNEISAKLSLPGVVVAHSGTYIGFLVDKRHPMFIKKIRELANVVCSMGYNYEIYDL
ncbi:GHMP family kinase ATP-binding protein [Parachlamydia acanthamoebae]|uniref:GHMP family kinase ATP-binding protein n=1 Tax=Parachlamydia acanthamoebae TaxID=83552 RepID=UPI0007509EE5|nr:hypothetical protein [Parachlamydia acanthamoebae]